MHRLIINKLGPIEHCELDCKKFMTFTGFQASGKSTIAKAIFFFRTVKDDIYSIAENNALNSVSDASSSTLKNQLIEYLREKFLRVFGSSWAMDMSMYIEYQYTDEIFIKIMLDKNSNYPTPNYVWVELSKPLQAFLKNNSLTLTATALGVPEKQQKDFLKVLHDVFDDEYQVVYIPAGRSMLTMLSQQLSYIYATMKDTQKRMLDYCTQDYIERILRLKSEYTDGYTGIVAYHGIENGISKGLVNTLLEFMLKILKGTYRYNDGEERIYINDSQYVKMNFASSGQQESVWILNLIFYYIVRSEPVLFIIEEPESNLFPESQKYITELISLANHYNHAVILTTHSPYVLGTLNNLLYANQLDPAAHCQASRIIPDNLWLDYEDFDAWFLKHGSIENCMDDELHMIQNEKIDEISKTINSDFDQLLELQLSDE